MPTYEYQCPKCKYEIEIFHWINEKPKIKCEKCQTKMNKMIGPGLGIIFKGSGFYETDYKQKENKNVKN